MKIGGDIRHGYMGASWDGDITECSDRKCGRLVKNGDACFVELQSGALYCDGCGRCKRYIRKMAEKREAKELH
jgi:hypothetical protein